MKKSNIFQKAHIWYNNDLLRPNLDHVILRYFPHGDSSRKISVLNRISKLSDSEVQDAVDRFLAEFSHRHAHFEETLLAHFEIVSSLVSQKKISQALKLLIGSYFTCEYSIEAAALFNPSIVMLDETQRTFVLSLRATGEGHISSITFRTGNLAPNHHLILDPHSHKCLSPKVNYLLHTNTYEAKFPAESPVNEHVIFPVFPIEKNGMEDARFVKFTHDDGETTFFGTYTAYDGNQIAPMFIETKDFRQFFISPFSGQAAANKGIAFFPRKINGRYMALGRMDGENLYLLYSDHPRHWNEYRMLVGPSSESDLIQIGNCGSPIETPHGWLVITHGVGTLRKYTLGLMMLDLNEPEKIIGILKEPFMSADEHEREGYVPNVLYTCGATVSDGHLILPFGLSDHRIGAATFHLESLYRDFI